MSTTRKVNITTNLNKTERQQDDDDGWSAPHFHRVSTESSTVYNDVIVSRGGETAA